MTSDYVIRSFKPDQCVDFYTRVLGLKLYPSGLRRRVGQTDPGPQPVQQENPSKSDAELVADAMGAMTRVATDSDEPLLSVPADAREKLYAEIPQLQCLQYWLEEDPQLQNDFRDPELDDYRAGSFYWAIRRAAQYEGIYADAATADAYWQSVADAINAACDNGTLPARSGRRSATSQPIRSPGLTIFDRPPT